MVDAGYLLIRMHTFEGTLKDLCFFFEKVTLEVIIPCVLALGHSNL